MEFENTLYDLDVLLEKLKNGTISLRKFIAICSRYLISDVYKRTEFLDKYGSDILERLYYIINDIHEVVKCKYCGNKAIWTGRIGEGYKDICNAKECKSKQLSDLHKGKTNISSNRNMDFIHKQASLIKVNDEIIKDLIKYDKYLEFIDNPIILDYLDNRFRDSSSRLETVQRIRFGIEEKPKCPTCGKPVVWVGKQSKLYTTYCSNICRARNEEHNNKIRPLISNTLKNKKFNFNK